MPRQLFHAKTYSVGRTITTEYQGEPVTPSDTLNLPSGPCSAITVTVAGNVNVQLDSDSTALLTLAVGEIYPIMLSRILATSTTATGIFALYPAGNL